MKAWMKTWAVLCLAVLIGWPMAAPAQTTHTLPLVRPADFASQESLVRIVNRSDTSGTVQVNAIDDDGDRFGPVTLTLGARQALNITSSDWERGNAAKGLPVGIGDGRGSWRLELTTELTIDALAYIRTPDGFLTSMHDEAPVSGGSHWVPFFNPGSNTTKVSHLRIINPGATAAEVTVTGRDDGGNEASGTVRLTLPAGAARTLTALQLEAGGEGFDGSLGDGGGGGKWRLNVRSTTNIQVMSLLSTRTGHLANLSTVPEPPPEPPPPGRRFRDCPGCPEMVVVPAGRFMMGSPDSEVSRSGNEGPAHRVTFVRPYAPFAVGVHEVTRGEFARFVEATSRSMVGCYVYGRRWFWHRESNWMDPLFDQTDAHPVVCVSWLDAKAYVRWLSGETGETYRLLSEAEWEYVARAGTSTARYWGESQVRQCSYANGADSGTDYPRRWVGCDDGYEKTAPVGSFSANAFGLHDVMGNVREWVEDPFRGGYRGAPSDGSVWEGGGGNKTLRGGGWYSEPAELRSAQRISWDYTRRVSSHGFRVARVLRP